MSTKAILVVAFALSMVLTSSVPAQNRSRSYTYDPATGAYAQQHRRAHSGYRNQSPYAYSRSPYDYRGRYRGTDPDPFVRDQLKRCREC
jgi:hypothetical protein